MIYLDAASTAKNEVDDIIIHTMTRAMEEYWQNPSSLYASDVKDKINECRAKIAKFIGAKSDEIYFTSGGSESNNWAIQGFVNKCWLNEKQPVVITSSIEHKSIMNCVNNLDADVYFVDVNNKGFVEFDELENVLMKAIAHNKGSLLDYSILVSIQLANNEIGTVNNIKMIADLVHEYGGILHSDMVQAVGHIPINVEKLNVDMASASGHKVSPVLKGIGFLYKKNGINIQPLIYGNQESGLRGGTENTFGIIGLSKAIEYCDISCESIDEMFDKSFYFINLLESKFGCMLNGDYDYRLPSNINVTFPQNITGESLLYTLEMSNIFISTSSACNSKAIEPSHVLKAIGLTDKEAMRTVRFTLPNDITKEDIDKVIKEIEKAIAIIEV